MITSRVRRRVSACLTHLLVCIAQCRTPFLGVPGSRWRRALARSGATSQPATTSRQPTVTTTTTTTFITTITTTITISIIVASQTALASHFRCSSDSFSPATTAIQPTHAPATPETAPRKVSDRSLIPPASRCAFSPFSSTEPSDGIGTNPTGHCQHTRTAASA